MLFKEEKKKKERKYARLFYAFPNRKEKKGRKKVEKKSFYLPKVL